MEMLYKYYSNESMYAFENLEKEVICFTPIESLNDPFEGFGEYIYPISPEGKNYLDSISLDTYIMINKDMSKEVKKIANFRYRIFCSSKEYNNSLLWTHYANESK